jgi:hypothetical protein
MSSQALEGIIKQFQYYKSLGDRTIQQVEDAALFYQFNEESNSIAIIIRHLHGNMVSRWTEFLTADGEKEWRNRDAEFEVVATTREELMALWESGWQCLFKALNALTPADLDKVVYIRNQGHTVEEAIHRQLAHYPYHVGQMVYIGKMLCRTEWQSLSIPKNTSKEFNAEMFAKEKQRAHFTDEQKTPVQKD